MYFQNKNKQFVSFTKKKRIKKNLKLWPHVYTFLFFCCFFLWVADYNEWQWKKSESHVNCEIELGSLRIIFDYFLSIYFVCCMTKTSLWKSSIYILWPTPNVFNKFNWDLYIWHFRKIFQSLRSFSVVFVSFKVSKTLKMNSSLKKEEFFQKFNLFPLEQVSQKREISNVLSKYCHQSLKFDTWVSRINFTFCL